MAVPLSNTKLRVPSGFRTLLESFAREVLRNQPKDIYQFGFKYFSDLVDVRNETNYDPTELEINVDDEYYNIKDFDVPVGTIRDENTPKELNDVVIPSSIYSISESFKENDQISPELVEDVKTEYKQLENEQNTGKLVEENEDGINIEPKASIQEEDQENEVKLQVSEQMKESINIQEVSESQVEADAQDEGFVEQVNNSETEEIKQEEEFESNVETMSLNTGKEPTPQINLEEYNQINQASDDLTTLTTTEEITESNIVSQHISEINISDKNDTQDANESTHENVSQNDSKINVENENTSQNVEEIIISDENNKLEDTSLLVDEDLDSKIQVVENSENSEKNSNENSNE